MRDGRHLRRIGLALIAAAIVTAAAGVGVRGGTFRALRARATDAVFPRGTPDERVLVVGIDTASLAATKNDWPWPRPLLASLIDGLADAGARVVVLDLTLAADRGADDDPLVAAMARVPTVVASFPAGALGHDPDLDVATVDPASMVLPTPRIAEAAAGVGHAAVIVDASDGVVRRLPLVVDDGTTFVPSLSIAALAAAKGVRMEQLVLRPKAVQLGSDAIPVAARHELIVNYTDGYTSADAKHTYVSAADVLAGRVDAKRINNRAVFVGVTDRGLGDHVLTPQQKGAAGAPGVSVHANALATMTQRTFLRPISDAETLAVVGIVGLVVALVTLLAGIVAGGVAAVGSVVAVLVVAYGPRASSGRFLDIVYPTLAALFAFVVASLSRYLVSDRQRRRATQLFRQYVPTKVSDELLARGLLDDAVAGMKVTVSTMFCDLRGFTAMTHELGPKALREILDHYYAYATEIVERHDGTLMQFVGDEVYAVFGAPLPMHDHSARAIQCGIDLVSEVARLDDVLRGAGHRTIRFGVGVATGEAIAAHVGNTSRRQYTVVGDAVNLGARLCSQARAGDVVMSELAAHTTSAADGAEIDHLTLKGFDEPYAVRRFVTIVDAAAR